MFSFNAPQRPKLYAVADSGGAFLSNCSAIFAVWNPSNSSGYGNCHIVFVTAMCL